MAAIGMAVFVAAARDAAFMAASMVCLMAVLVLDAFIAISNNFRQGRCRYFQVITRIMGDLQTHHIAPLLQFFSRGVKDITVTFKS